MKQNVHFHAATTIRQYLWPVSMLKPGNNIAEQTEIFT